MSAIDDLSTDQAGRPGPEAAAEQLTAILGLHSVRLRVTGARVVGRGSLATADLYLSDGSVIEFERLRDMATPKLLAVEIAAATGACPKINAQQAIRAVALVRALAEHQVTVSDDDLAREWGQDFLQAADVLDVDLSDQAQRWDAFSRLDKIELGNHHGEAIASAALVLRDTDGSRLVRTGWFRDHVRATDRLISPGAIAVRMQRVGWRRPGQSGHIKATRPGMSGHLAWRFYVVPEAWETAE